ncbi:MAG TPA: TonB-dependent receptor, partial [Pyrinomonadaceae bacterium]|nr:TonB-dependent receptor [Pyrinomonadaceae bacterium]
TMSLLTLCLALFTMGGAMAQTQSTGSIEGTVLDPQGGAVPNATVTVSGPNLISPQSATTNDEGRYRILNLPPGRYTVTVAAVAGFGEATKSDVEVNLSRTTSADVQVQIAGAAASVTITDTTGAGVDVTANTSGTNVSTEQFSNFPTQRTVQSLYTIAPTVARSGQRDASGRDRDPSVAGSSGPENNYILDGVNATDPAFGGSGANLPFEFVQEIEIKTGAFGAEYGRATGGIFNVITKSGGNEFRGDAFAYFTTKGFVSEVKNIPLTGAIANGFSEIDAGFDLGGPIIKDKLWFFGAFNPQRRKNFLLTQTFLSPVENTITTPFYAGKITWGINQNHTLTFSTSGDRTKQEGFLFGNTGFGADVNSFLGEQQTGGERYTVRLNSSLTPTWIGEFSFGIHRQRNNIIPPAGLEDVPLNLDNFRLLATDGSTVVPVTESNVSFIETTGALAGQNLGRIAFVQNPGGASLERNFIQQGFGIIQTTSRRRTEFNARLQNIIGRNTLKYGFEYSRNFYDIANRRSGPARTFTDPFHVLTTSADNLSTNGYQTTNSFQPCTTRVIGGNNTVVCAAGSGTRRVNQLIAGGGLTGFPGGAITGPISLSELLNNSFLVLISTRVRDFELDAKTYSDVESFYIQDDFKISKDVQFNFGLRWDYQQSYSEGGDTYLKLNNFKDNLQPRIGLIWDFTGRGRGKMFANFARFVEAPLPLDVNVRAGGGDTQTDKQFNASRYGAFGDATLVAGVGGGAQNFGAEATPIDPDLKPQTVNEVTAGIEYGISSDLVLGARGIYRSQGSVIEDGSFDDGVHYFLFNPGESLTDRLAREPAPVGVGSGFGRARRYYRAMEFTATKRFSNHYQFIASYVYSSLIGNYEGLFRNDTGQLDPNITSLFDLVSLLGNTYGRLNNDRPHQFKFNGSYETPFKLMVSGNFYIQSGIPFNKLVPHPDYGNNEGYGEPRGSSIVPNTADTFDQGGVESAYGSTRTPTTWNLDVGAYYPIQFGERRQLRFQFDMFNVFNNQRAIRLDETFAITLRQGANVPDVPNPFYGTGTIFQFPRSMRLGVKFSF